MVCRKGRRSEHPRLGTDRCDHATFVERYEFGPIDDNILITVCATAVLLLGVQLH